MNRLTEEIQIGPFAALKDKAETVPGAFGTYDCFFAHEMAVTRLKKYEDTGLEPEEIGALASPPNPPLTLDELREMDREPVWVEFPKRPEANGWMLISDDRNSVYNSLLYCDFENCGKTWLAYRRKP